MPRARAQDVREAARVLAEGGLVGLPTETVYGLAADGSNPDAVRRIFAVKGRPAWHPLILHLADASWLDRLASAPPSRARALAEAFWPGPLTLVLRRSASVLEEVTAGLETVALRVPAHPLALQVIAGLGRPIAAPSANRFGRVSPTTAEHVRQDLGEAVDLVLDGGPCGVGIESTIVDLTTEVPRLLRPGGIDAAALEGALGCALAREGPGARSPGQLPAHYAPRADLFVFPHDALVSFANTLCEEGEGVAIVTRGSALRGLCDAVVIELPRDLGGFARGLYAALRQADDRGVSKILVEQIPGLGVGEAIADRLARAAQG